MTTNIPNSITSITNLGLLNGSVTLNPIGINSSGAISGIAGSVLGVQTNDGFIWNGQSTLLGPLAGGTSAEAYGLNDNGDVVGVSFTAETQSGQGTGEGVLWKDANGGGQIALLGTLSGDNSSLGIGINDHDQVVGISLVSGNGAYHGFIWQNGEMTNLGTLGGQHVEPFAINNAGQVTGKADNYAGVYHAFLWQNGSMTDLGTLPGGTSSTAASINQSGEVVGQSTNAAGALHATSWYNGTVTDLGLLPGGYSSVANSVNDSGVVAGVSSTVFQNQTAVVWGDGTIFNLNTLLPSGSGWILNSATAINDLGQVTGTGTDNGQSAAFSLTLPQLTVTASVALTDQSEGLAYGPMSLSDSSSNIVVNLGGLTALAGEGHLGSISLTDGGQPVLAVSAAQLAADAPALDAISSSFTLDISAGTLSSTIVGVHGQANVVIFTGDASQYSVTANSSGNGVTVSNALFSDQLNGVTALQFADQTEVLAQPPGSSTVVTTGNITELYGAVFGREPDAGGLAYYQNVLAANPNLPLTVFAQWFLASPEYTGNPEHDYPQTAAGQAKFITDTYNNLLNRAPDSSGLPFYENLINQITQGQTPGTAGYTTALTQAYAVVLSDFSASAEFLSDVQITSQHPADHQHWLLLI